VAHGEQATTATRPCAATTPDGHALLPALAGCIEEHKVWFTLFFGFSCPTLNSWEYMGVKLSYISE